jgi:hypothetical protein
VADIELYFDAWIDSLQLMKRFRKLFITGCAKSGTTWLVKLLNGHPQIVADGEGRFAWRLYTLFEQSVDMFNKDQTEMGGSALGLVSRNDLAMLLRASTDNVLHRYLLASGKQPQTVKVVADKTPQHVFHMRILRTLYPNGRFINIIRDPRDAATSALFHLAKGDTGSREEYLATFIQQSWFGSVATALAGERELGTDAVLNVRYEDLHSNPDPVIRKCLMHLGVDASERMVQTCRDAGSFEKLSGGRQRGETDNNSFFRNGQVGDWKNHIDPELARKCCLPVAALMRDLGYELDLGPVSVTVHVGAQAGAISAINAAA